MRLKTNYHTHIYRCGHATGDVEDYVLEGIRKGYTSLGISDHGPLPDYLFDRMKIEELDEYLKSIELAKEKHGHKINIYSALELEYFPEFEDYYKKLKGKFDYLILGNHYFVKDKKLHSSWGVKTKEDLKAFSELTIKALESGYFDFVAHPDLFSVSYKNWDDAAIKASYTICNKAKELDIPLELNANGVRKGLHPTDRGMRYLYPNREFWEIAQKVEVKVLINSDCHIVEELDDLHMEKTRKLGKEWKLNIVKKWM